MHKSSYLSSSRDCERIFFKLQDEEKEEDNEDERGFVKIGGIKF